MSVFSFPELYCPFPSKVNKYADILEDYAIEWVLSFNLLANESSYKRFSKSRFFYLSAIANPDCGFEELKIVNDWITWLFIWDDQCDMSDLGKEAELVKSYHNRFLEILKGSKLTKKDVPLAHALGDLQKRIFSIGNNKGFKQFIDLVEEYFDGCLVETDNRIQHIIPDSDTYTNIHMLSSAVESTIELILLCNHVILPDFLRKHPTLSQLRKMTNKITCRCNDIFSANRENASGDFHNLVLVFYHQDKLSWNGAIQRAAEMHNQELQILLNLEASLPTFSEQLDTDVAKYISLLHCWIRGNYDWSVQTDRYKTTEKLELLQDMNMIAS